MSQGPYEPPPQPIWDPQRGQWYIPGPQPQYAGGPGMSGSESQSRYGQQPYGVPGHVPPPPPPPKKTKKWPWIVGAVVLLILILAIGSGGGTPAPTTAASASPSAAAPSSAAAPADSSSAVVPAAPTSAAPTSAAPTSAAAGGVVYEVSGSGKAMNITYGEIAKGLSQLTSQSLPWTKSATSTEGFAIYGLTAQNAGSGEITCSITVDGRQIATNTSSGQYAVVSCNGSTSPF